MMDWIKVIIFPRSTLKISKKDYHRFQIFATVTCDLLWSGPIETCRATMIGLSFDALQKSININKVSLEHIMAWKHLSNTLIEEKWIPPLPYWFKINFNITIRDTYAAQAVVCRNHYGHIIRMTS
jgi:hypothetical protein